MNFAGILDEKSFLSYFEKRLGKKLEGLENVILLVSGKVELGRPETGIFYQMVGECPDALTKIVGIDDLYEPTKTDIFFHLDSPNQGKKFCDEFASRVKTKKEQDILRRFEYMAKAFQRLKSLISMKERTIKGRKDRAEQ